MEFANHYLEQQLIYENLNDVLRWTVAADLGNLGGNDINVKKRILPIIDNPYESLDFRSASGNRMFAIKKSASAKGNSSMLPMVRCIDVDNYSGNITVISDYANRLDWLDNRGLLCSKFNLCGKFLVRFCVENIVSDKIYFRLTGDGGILTSKPFLLSKE